MIGSFSGERDALDVETLAGLAENIVYRLPGCTDMMVRKALQDVYRDFCRRSCCLHTTRRISLQNHTRHYHVSASYDSMSIDCVSEVSLGRRVLERGRDYDVRGVGRSVCVELSHRLPVPHCGCHDDLFVTCVEVPRIGSEFTPDGFLDKYGDDLVSGVMYRLMSMTGKPWSDPEQARVELSRYEERVGAARIGYHTGSLSGNGDTGFGIDTSDLI